VVAVLEVAKETLVERATVAQARVRLDQVCGAAAPGGDSATR
jgi:hypothetical protein